MDLPRRGPSARYARLQSSASFADTFSLVFWVTSTYWYKRQFFVHNRNMFSWALFSAGSLFASFAYGKFLFETSRDGAARINNEREDAHQKSLGHH